MGRQASSWNRFGIIRAAAAVGVAWLGLAVPALAVNGTWNMNANATWGTSSNWLGGVPGGAGEIADLSKLDITTSTTISLGANRTIGSLLIGDASGTSIYNLTGNTLVFSQVGGATLTSSQSGGLNSTNIISSAVTSTASNLTVQVNGGGSISLQGSAVNFANRTVTNSGTGTGAFTFGGSQNTAITGPVHFVQDSPTSPMRFSNSSMGGNPYTGTTSILRGQLSYGTNRVDSLGTSTNPVILGNSAGGTDNADFLVNNSVLSYGTGGTVGPLPYPIRLSPNTTGTLSVSKSSGNSAVLTGGITGTNSVVLRVLGSGSLSFTTAALNNVGTITNSGTGSGLVNIGSSIGANVTGLIQSSTSSALILGAQNNFVGTTQLLQGRIQLNNANALRFSPIDTVGSGSLTLSSGSAAYAFGGLISGRDLGSLITGTSQVNMTTLVLQPQSGTVTYNNAITDMVPGMMLIKDGAGTQVLGGTNTFTGVTSVQNGVLVLQGEGALLTTSTVTVNVGSTLRLGSNKTLGKLDAGSGTIDVQSFTLAVGDDDLSLFGAFGGAIAGVGGSLVKQGSDSLSLTGPNTYTGATSITGGILAIDAGNINSTSGITVNGSTARLTYNSSDAALTAPLTLTRGALGGAGTIATPVTFGANTVIAPGNSPGTLSFASLHAWAPGGGYDWELNALSGTAGTDWDTVDVTSGTFSLANLTTASSGKFAINLITLTMSNGDQPGPLDVEYDGGTYVFPFVSYNGSNFILPSSGTFTNTPGTDLTSFFSINTAGWQTSGTAVAPSAGNVRVKVNSTATGLDLVIVPEPATLALAVGGIAALALVIRRRRAA